MSTHRFYVHPKQVLDDTICIRGADVWHLTKVLRLSPGAQVIVFDGAGREYRVVINKIKPREVLTTILEQWERQAESPLQLILMQGVPKADKMDVIIQKTTEIGVNRIIPLQTERSEIGVRLKQSSPEKVTQKLDRWSRIGVEAAKQSCRTKLPIIETIMTISEALALPLQADLRLICWEAEQAQRLTVVLREQTAPVQSAMIAIGPEGGFTPDEAAQFTSNGYHSVSLGPRILRTETAGLVVCGILQYAYGDY